MICYEVSNGSITFDEKGNAVVTVESLVFSVCTRDVGSNAFYHRAVHKQPKYALHAFKSHISEDS